MNSYRNAIAFLYGLQSRGMKFGLRGIRSVLKDLGDPQKRIACVHIAGSNGKGSTAALIASALSSAGYKTGLYTSPHIVDFTERIRINGKPVPRKVVLRLTRRLETTINRRRITFFEAATAIAFQYFAEKKVEIAVIETGLGGRLDATNIIRPYVSVITSVSLEHTDILGNSLAEIAYEKGGIIKPHVPCVTGVRSREGLRVLRTLARSRKSVLRETGGAGSAVRLKGIRGVVANFQFGADRLLDLFISLPGRHQVRNAAMALAALEELNSRGFRVRSADVRQGFARVEALTGLHSRLAVVRRKPMVLSDVAHNAEAFEALVAALKELRIGKVILMFGIMADKPLKKIVRRLIPAVHVVLAVQPGTSRACPAPLIAREFRSHGVPVLFEGTVPSGIRRALSSAGRRAVLMTGSHFVVGEALAVMRRKKYLTINQ